MSIKGVMRIKTEIINKLGKVVLFDVLPNSRPLLSRKNLVITKTRELIFKGFIIACFIFPLESCVRRSRILCPKLVVHRLLLIRLKPTIQIRCHKRLAQVLRIVCCTCLTLPTQNFVMCILEGALLVSVKSVTLL